jgi:hypothetical protein
MEPGLGTNPRSSGSGVGRGCQPIPGRPQIQGAVSEEERAKSESKSKASRWSQPVANAKNPNRTSRIPTPQGGWVGLRAPEKEWC